MGHVVSTVRKALDQSDEESKEMEQRLNMLEKMVNYHLDNAKTSMLSGERDDQEIHSGTVVEFTKQVNVHLYKGSKAHKSLNGDSDDGADLEGAIKEFLVANLRMALKKSC